MGNFSAFDLLVALMLGELVDEIIYGDALRSQGILDMREVQMNEKDVLASCGGRA